MQNDLTILTGASRGMGLSMAQQLMSPNRTLLCISRHSHEALASRSAAAGCTVLQWTADLAQGADVSRRLQAWLEQQDSAAFGSATLINNAGVIPRIGPLSQAEPDDLARALRVGLEAPMQLTAAFLAATAHWPALRKVLNMSSGLGRRAMASQAAYCAAKAGMDHFTRCLALDEALKPQGAKVCSLAPGVIDTDMQTQLRSAPEADFPDKSGFVSLKTAGQLTSPDAAAQRILTFLARADFGSQPVADVRD